jgi:hypothetical protein
MDQELRRLRAEVQRLAQGKARSQVRYPAAFRRAALALVRTRRGRGGSVARLAQDLGISLPTLTKWLRAKTLPVLRPVSVAPTPVPERHGGGGTVLITPNGVRVEGLDRDLLISVLRAVG